MGMVTKLIGGLAVDVLDLFSGIGGFSLGLERAGMKTTAFCENNPYAQKVLTKHWPLIPIYKDIKNLCYSKLTVTPQLICGGFPCQPFSSASHGVIMAEDLWPEMLRIVKEIRSDYVIAENVKEKPIRKAEDDLKKLGYNTTAIRIGAHEAGADHKRNRWWLCAHSHNESEFSSEVNAETSLLPELCEGVWTEENYSRTIRVSDGIPNRMDRLKCLGNSVLPQIPELFGRVILRFN